MLDYCHECLDQIQRVESYNCVLDPVGGLPYKNDGGARRKF